MLEQNSIYTQAINMTFQVMRMDFGCFLMFEGKVDETLDIQ